MRGKYNSVWTKEKCHKEALKYETKKEFYTNRNDIYRKSIRNGWLNEICSHMASTGNKYKRCIYVWEFDDNFAYIGLTYNLTKRMKRHQNDINGSVYKHLKLSNGICKQLTDYIDVEESQKQENYYIDFYKNNNWKVLNNRNGGGLGASKSDLTKEECQKIALDYKDKYDFRKNETKTYNLICRNNWLDVCNHMINIRNGSSYWTYERCKEEASKYKSKTEFSNNCSSAYKNSFKNNWLDDWFLDKRKFKY